MKFIRALVECSMSPNDTINDICPNGQYISLLNPRSEVVVGVIYLLISKRSLLKQRSYKTSEAEPPSTYMRCMRWSPTSALTTIGLSCPSLLASVDALIRVVAFISVELAKLVFVLVLCEASHRRRCFEFHRIYFKDFFWSFNEWSEPIIPPTRLLHLIESGLVMLCMNLDTIMHFGASFTCMLSALKHSMKASVDLHSFFLI
ncbi:hypothetical protein Tco_0041772, partial [Tanacetum coccineum]